MKISVIIPVFRGESTIEPLFNRIKESLSGKYGYEVIFVDDNSSDNSWSYIKSLYNKNTQVVKGYRLRYNYGQHKATLFGISKAVGDIVVTMDEDMQHDPFAIPDMLSYISDNGLDVLYGKFFRYQKDGIRKFGSEVSRKIAGCLVPNLNKSYSPFRIIRSETALALKSDKSVVFIDSLIGQITKKIGEFPVEHLKSRRPSSYSFGKLTGMATSVILNYSPVAGCLFVLFIIFMFYLSLAPLIHSSGNNFFLAGLPSAIIAVILSGQVLYLMIQSKMRKDIYVSETAGDI